MVSMGIECMKNCFKDESAAIPSIPPGFGAPASFPLGRTDEGASGSFVASASITLQSEVDEQKTVSCEEKFSKCLRQRPSINYSQFDNSSEEESDSVLPSQKVPAKCCLPKGIIRGCAKCSNCQKVTARWRPEKACRPAISDAPVFYPTEEEFEDTLKYISSIQPKAESYGICLIVPPPSWNPPCPLKKKDAWENHKFSTRIQKINKLQNRHSARKMSSKNKRRRLMGANGNAERFGFEPGPEFTLKSFESYANDFKDQYFRLNENENFSNGKPSVEAMEGEYWRMVEKPTEEIEVLYGADIDTGSFGSGFTKMSTSISSSLDDKYAKSGWNLNNFPRLSGSALAFEESDISGVLVPWLYVGMCFSSFCWHVEDHHFYSLNYMHWGAPKIWYGVPGNHALKLETAMKKHLPELFEEQPDLLHNLVTQFSPATLIAEGVPVFRCVQNPGQFVLTFPRAYHAGFNCGFNCAEAVNVAPLDWLPHGQFAVELYREQKRKISVSHDKLLLGAAREAVRAQWNMMFLGKKSTDNLRWKDACGTNNILARVLKTRIEIEHSRRESICPSSFQMRKMDANFDADSERECTICHYDLHLSAVGCSCSSERFACLEHGREMCACSWDSRFFLYRYEINELNLLLDAVGGKLSAVHRWALLDLGLSLSSYIHKDKTHQDCSNTKPGEGAKPTEQRLVIQSSKTNSISPPQDVQVSMHGSVNGISMGKDAKVADLDRTTINQSVSKLTLNGLLEGTRKVCAEENDALPKTELHDRTVQITGPHENSDTPGQAGCLGGLHSIPTSTTVCKIKDLSKLNNVDIIQLSDDEQDEACDMDKIKMEATENQPEMFDRSMDCSNKFTTSNCDKDQSLETLDTDACVIDNVDVKMSTSQDKGKEEVTLPPSSCSFSANQRSSTAFADQIQEYLASTRLSNNDDSIVGSSQTHSCMNMGSGINNKSFESSFKMNVRGDLGVSSQPVVQSCTDRLNRQGPRMAKVVRRINSSVEPLAFGVVLPGKFWSCGQAIFPKGFRSRVRYFSVLDPSQMCYYISEILDAGLPSPLFMVLMENCPNEVFIHLSATRCWDMVRDRVNSEIRKQHALGRAGTPALQPPGSIDGLEMFGLTSLAIIKAIEEIDVDRISWEYWKSKPRGLKDLQMPEAFSLNPRPLAGGGQLAGASHSPTILHGLLRKLNPEELQLLNHTLAGHDNGHCSKEEALKLISDEIEGRLKPS